MPAHGDHLTGLQTFGDNSPHRPMEYTGEEHSAIQDSLNRQLGPEWTLSREGPSRSTVYYIPTHRAIDLANSIFGFNGWSSSIKDVKIDYIDTDDKGNLTVGCSVLCRVTLKDGTFHEDMGYGESKTKSSKAAAFEHARKTASSDALKRTLRQFGSAMGNCIYDKSYLNDLRKLPKPNIKTDVKALYRHPAINVPSAPGNPAQQAANQVVPAKRRATGDPIPSVAHNDTDEYATDVFDDLDFLTEDDICLLNGAMPSDESDSTITTEPLRITGPEPPGLGASRTLSDSGIGSNQRGAPQSNVSSRPNQSVGGPTGGNVASNGNNRGSNGINTSAHASAHPPGRQPMPPNRPQVDVQQRGPILPPQSRPQPPNHISVPNQPPQNRAQTAASHSITNGKGAQPQPQPQPQRNQQGAPLNTSRYAPNAPAHHPAAPSLGPNQQPNGSLNQPKSNFPNPSGAPPVGFYNSRAAEHLAKDDITSPALANMTFDPKAPFKGKNITQGVSHSKSGPVTREAVGQAVVEIGSAAVAARPAGSIPPLQQGGSRPNFINPQNDTNRRIGMPPVANQSPMGNRGAYKPPGPAPGVYPVNSANGNVVAGVKRTADSALDRTPLSNLNGGKNPINYPEQEQAMKKPKIEAGESATGENAALK